MKKILVLLNLLVLLGISGSLFSAGMADETGTIQGIVIDGASGEPLMAATVAIQGTSFGTSTDLNGEYAIFGVPAGTYTLVFRFIGYKPLEETGVRVNSDESVELNVELNPQPIEGVEVTILGQARGQMAAINQQRAANSIKNIVSSEKIRDVPDVNAAESIGRLPGVSLRRSGGEGNQVVVRGLSPEYTIVEVDGVRLQGVGLGRDVGLSTISSEMLDGIELSKSLTADQDADAIGGVVNLRTRTAKEGFHFNILTQGGYNSLENSLANYKHALSVSNRFFDNKFGVIGTGSIEQVYRSSDRYSAGYLDEPILGDSVNGEREVFHEYYTQNENIRELKTKRYRQHGGLVLDYKSKFMTLKLNNTYSRMVNENVERRNQFLHNAQDFRHIISDSKPEEIIQSHSLSSLFKFLSTELTIDAQYSRTTLENFNDVYRFDVVHNLIDEEEFIYKDDRYFADPYQLMHRYDISTANQSYVENNTRTGIDREDITKRINLDWEVPFALAEKVSGNIKVGGSYSVKNRSSDTESYWSYYHGGIGEDRADRVLANNPDFVDYNVEGYRPGKSLPGINFVDPEYDYGDVLRGITDVELGWSADLDLLKEVHDYFGVDEEGNRLYPDNQIYGRGVESSRDDYSNVETYTAGYIMAEVFIGKRITLLPGVRYENMQTSYTANYVVENAFAEEGILQGYPQPVTVDDRSNQNFFPSLNFKVDITDWIDVRGAYYKSTSRPSYHLLSPAMVSDFDKKNITAYNPYLEPALAHNYDLGVSFFDNKLGLLTFNLFYKTISDLLYRIPNYNNGYFEIAEGLPPAIVESLEAPRKLYREDLFNDLTGRATMNNYPINNPNQATFKGFEVSWQTSFWYLPNLLRGLVLDLNYSFIRSQNLYPYLAITTTFTDDFIPKPITNVDYMTREGTMLDQPNSIYNARIGWDYKGFSSRLSFRYQGKSLQGLDPTNENEDRYKDDHFRMDLQVKQKITQRLSALVDVANLTSAMDVHYMSASGNNLPSLIEYYGLNAQFSLRYDF